MLFLFFFSLYRLTLYILHLISKKKYHHNIIFQTTESIPNFILNEVYD